MVSRDGFSLVATQSQSTGSGMVPGLSKNYSVNVGLLVLWLTVDRRHCGVMRTTGSGNSNLPLLNPPNSINACFFSLIWNKYSIGHKKDGEKSYNHKWWCFYPHTNKLKNKLITGWAAAGSLVPKPHFQLAVGHFLSTPPILATTALSLTSTLPELGAVPSSHLGTWGCSSLGDTSHLITICSIV